MDNNERPPQPLVDQGVQAIVDNTLSGNAHFKAWCAVVDALFEADPTWCVDRSKSAVQNAVAWIKERGNAQA